MGRACVEDNEEKKREDLPVGDQAGEGHENFLQVQPNA